MQHSHIQLPKFIINNYKQKDNRVVNIDLNNENIIRNSYPKTLGTQVGYYSQEMEDLLNHEVESKFSMIVSKLKNLFNKKINSVNLTENDIEIIKKYFITSIGRGNLLKKSFLERSIFKNIYDDQILNDMLVYYSMNKDNLELFGIKDNKLIIVYNKTKLGIVVGRNCYFIFYSNGIETIGMPVSPKIMLCFVPKECAYKTEDIKTIDDEEDIKQINNHVAYWEYFNNHEFVIGDNINELKRLQQILNNITLETNI